VFIDDNYYVGGIVPLPNHYISDMPQGHGAVRIFRAALLFLRSIYYNTKMKDKKTSAQKPEENIDEVKLKPFMGIRPGVYLTILYLFVILAVLFILLIQPGLKNPTAALIVTSEPAGAGIRVNDIYAGVAGSKIIVPKGEHTITAVMPGFEAQSAVHKITSRIFASHFFPRVHRIAFTLRSADPVGAFTQYAYDYASWSFGGEPTETWQIPMSLSEGAYRLGNEQLTENREQFQQILLAASRFAVTRVALRDLIRAKLLLDGYGNSPSPAVIIQSISDALIFLSENPGSAYWLSQLLPSDSAAIIKSSAWANSEYDAHTDFFPDDERNVSPPRLSLAGLNFRSMNSGKLLGKGSASTHRPYGHNTFISGFYLSETPVSISLFETFLNENPQWREHRTEYYPDEIASPQELQNRGYATGVNWYAAEAFCKWLTGQLPPSLSGSMEVRLPAEDEWEYAAISVNNMQNTGFEWCGSPYAPLNFIKAPDGAAQILSSPERSIRGRASASSAETRASFPPDLSSPFITFRPVIAEIRQ